MKKSGSGRGSNGKTELTGVKKLRELILELAVRGKLVEQNPTDEPASKLLERVRAEKLHLIKQGEIKKRRKLPELSEMTKPFNLPSSWEWSQLEDLGRDWGQKTPKDDFSYIDVTSVDSLRGEITQPSILSAEEAPSRARKIVSEGTLIYSTVRPYLQNIAVIESKIEPEPIASTAFAILHPLAGMPARFYLHYLRSPAFVRYVESVQTGIAYPAINDKQFFSGLVPIPPLEEQHRIVQKVDELMALCDRLEQQTSDQLEAHETLVDTLLGTLTQSENATELADNWARLAAHFDTLFSTEQSIDKLKQSILQLAVMGRLVEQSPLTEPFDPTDLTFKRQRETLLKERKVKYREFGSHPDIKSYLHDIPDLWSWQALSSVVFFQEGPGIRKWQFRSSGVKLLNVSNILPDGSLDFENSDKHLDPEEFKSKYQHFAIQPGDLLFASSGGSWGKSSWFEEPGYTVMLNTSTVRLRFFSDSFCSGYLKHFLDSQCFKSQMQVQLVGMQPNFGSSHLGRVFIPIPPIEEQHRIVQKADELMALCDQLKERLSQANETRCQMAEAIVEGALN
ncbi:restriction endonuclease subunit S [Marinobacter salsuginis]|nr:restriction endonuclease subunit S [Marinobacter salsuginis]